MLLQDVGEDGGGHGDGAPVLFDAPYQARPALLGVLEALQRIH